MKRIEKWIYETIVKWIYHHLFVTSLIALGICVVFFVFAFNKELGLNFEKVNVDLKDTREIISVIVALLLSFVAFIVALASEYRSSKMIEHLGKNTEQLSHLPTKAIDVFPKNILEINKEIFDYCLSRKSEEGIELIIATEFLGYSSLMHNKYWNQYCKKIEELSESDSKIAMTLAYYPVDSTLYTKYRNRFIKNIQIEYIEKHKEWIKNIARHPKCHQHIHDKNCEHADRECNIIYTNITRYDEKKLEKCFDELQKHADKRIGEADVKTTKIIRLLEESQYLPFNSWFILKNGEPERAVVTFASYKKYTEEGIYTENKTLIRQLYAVVSDRINTDAEPYLFSHLK